MKVKDLIKKLQKENPEEEVITDDYEGGYSNVKEVKRVKVVFNFRTNNPYQGNHEIVTEEGKKDFVGFPQHYAVYVGR